MPHNLLRLAWAAPFDVDDLGATINAFLHAMPVIEALRLCNRHGVGKKAYVTKLPVELVDDIADKILVMERKAHANVWYEQFNCWKNDCDPTDHLTEREQQLLFLKMSGEDYQGYSLTAPGHEESPSLPELDADDLCELDLWLAEDRGDEHQDILPRSFTAVHRDRQMEWMAKVGYPGALCRGWFSHNREAIVRYLGLEVWAAHISFCCLHTAGCNHRLSQAFLTLPVPRDGRTDIPWDIVDGLEGEGVPTETSAALHVAMPKQPRKTLLSAFPRALSLLDLEIDSELSDQNVLAATEEDYTEKQVQSVWIDKKGEEHKSDWPKLMLLVINSHNGI